MPIKMQIYLEKLTEVKASELKAALLGFSYFFFLLGGYYVLRPVRDALGLAGGIKNLPWLFTATLITMFVISPVFSWLSGRYQRRKLIYLCYSFLLMNLLLFYAAYNFLAPETQVYTGRVFYIWLSVYNLFVVSLFWSFMADGFDFKHSKRLFAFIAAGGSLGAVTGSSITNFFVETLGVANLFLVSASALAIVLVIVHWLDKEFHRKDFEHPQPAIQTGSQFLKGIQLTFKSPYLLAICGYVFCYTLSSTFLYFFKANIVNDISDSTSGWAMLFSQIDLYTNIITFIFQFFLTAKLIKRFGITATLALLPVLTLIGFACLGIWPTISVLILFESIRRAANYAISKPSRESLFSTLAREEKYPAKNFIDTFVYRGGDATGAWLFGWIKAVGMATVSMAWIALPLAAAWIWLARFLGKHVADNSAIEK